MYGPQVGVIRAASLRPSRLTPSWPNHIFEKTPLTGGIGPSEKE